MILRVSGLLGFLLLFILTAEHQPIQAQTNGMPPNRTLPPTLAQAPNSGQVNAEQKEDYNPLKNCVPPDDPTSYQNRLQEYQISLEDDPDNPYLLQQLGTLHSRLLQWDKAQSYFFKALTYNQTKRQSTERRPNENQTSEIYRQLGDLYACQQQFDKAIDQYKQSLRSSPQDLAEPRTAEQRSDVKNNLALTQLLAQQNQEGARLLERYQNFILSQLQESNHIRHLIQNMTPAGGVLLEQIKDPSKSYSLASKNIAAKETTLSTDEDDFTLLVDEIAQNLI